MARGAESLRRCYVDINDNDSHVRAWRRPRGPRGALEGSSWPSGRSTPWVDFGRAPVNGLSGRTPPQSRSSRVQMASCSRFTGNWAQGCRPARTKRARHARRSAPCSTHSTLPSVVLNSPEDSSNSSCVHWSSRAYSSPSRLNTTIGVPVTRRTHSSFRPATARRRHRQRSRLAHATAPVNGFSRISKRRSSRLGMPKRSSPYGNGFLMPVRL